MPTAERCRISDWLEVRRARLIIDMPLEYQLLAEGEIDYLTFYVPSPLTETSLSRRIEIVRATRRSCTTRPRGPRRCATTSRSSTACPYKPGWEAARQDEVRPRGTSVFEAPPQTKLICYVPGHRSEQHRPGTEKHIDGGRGIYIVLTCTTSRAAGPKPIARGWGYD